MLRCVLAITVAVLALALSNGHDAAHQATLFGRYTVIAIQTPLRGLVHFWLDVDQVFLSPTHYITCVEPPACDNRILPCPKSNAVCHLTSAFEGLSANVDEVRLRDTYTVFPPAWAVVLKVLWGLWSWINVRQTWQQYSSRFYHMYILINLAVLVKSVAPGWGVSMGYLATMALVQGMLVWNVSKSRGVWAPILLLVSYFGSV